MGNSRSSPSSATSLVRVAQEALLTNDKGKQQPSKDGSPGPMHPKQPQRQSSSGGSKGLAAAAIASGHHVPNRDRNSPASPAAPPILQAHDASGHKKKYALQCSSSAAAPSEKLQTVHGAHVRNEIGAIQKEQQALACRCEILC
jgi:hypothetical protein